jgi:hypothetical protein
LPEYFRAESFFFGLTIGLLDRDFPQPEKKKKNFSPPLRKNKLNKGLMVVVTLLDKALSSSY